MKKIAKRKRLVDTEKLIKEGGGQGLGKEYKLGSEFRTFLQTAESQE